MSQNTVYIYCNGGFGNRFFALLSGICLAKSFNYAIKVVWPINNWCGAAFNEIFDTTFEYSENIFNDIDKQNDLFISHNSNWAEHKYYLSLNESNVIEKIKENFLGKNIFFTNNSMTPFLNDPKNLQFVKFKKELIQLAEQEITQNTDSEFYGIHIRKTDFGNRSSLAENICLDIVKNNFYKKFFICSDDEETENKFCMYKNVFKFNKKDYVKKFKDGSWNEYVKETDSNFNVTRNASSVINAVVDLLILSKSNIVSPDVGSTFADAAKLISKSDRAIQMEQP
jgi:hypothetical protein